MKRTLFTPEQNEFRATVRGFLAKEAVPHTDAWETAGIVDREFWRKAALQGLVGFDVPAEFGGAGIRDFRLNVIVDEEVAYAGAVGDNFALQNDVLAPYLIELTNPEQQVRWLPAFVTGDLIAAIAMSEPGAGSDLRAIATRARRCDGGYVVDGSKTFVTSGIQADLVIVVARIAGAAPQELTLLAVDANSPGFTRGRKLEKIGRRAQDTAELFLESVEVPEHNRIGAENAGLDLLKRNLAQERLSIAVTAVAAAEAALSATIEYCRERVTFGRPIGRHQAVRFALAELRTETDVGRTYVDRCIEAHVAGKLTGADAASAKYWATELQFRVVDRCLQLHGGYGYMEEYPIARYWRDARVARIYGGTNEIMRDIVGRAMDL